MELLAFLFGVCVMAGAAAVIAKHTALFGTAGGPARPVQAPASQGQDLFLAGDGREVLTPQPLLAGRVYRLTFTGTFQYERYGFLSRHTHTADVAYCDEYCDEASGAAL